MFESFWKWIGDRGSIVILAWQTMSYFSDVTNVCWFLEPEFAQEVRRLHGLVGNAVTNDRYIVVGTGSTQLFQAALYALSPSNASEPINVVSAVPYYSVSSLRVRYFMGTVIFRCLKSALPKLFQAIGSSCVLFKQDLHAAGVPLNYSLCAPLA